MNSKKTLFHPTKVASTWTRTNDNDGNILPNDEPRNKNSGIFTADASGTAKQTNVFVTVIGPHDVLLGRGAIALSNEGNLRFRTLIQSRKDDYICTSRRRKKDVISKQIAKVISDRGGRFLRKVEDPEEAKALGVCPSQMDNAWIEVKEVTILKKIKQSLRDLDRECHDEKSSDDDDDESSHHKEECHTAKRSHFLCSYKMESLPHKKRPKAEAAAAAAAAIVSPDSSTISLPDKRETTTGRLNNSGESYSPQQTAIGQIPIMRMVYHNAVMVSADKRLALLDFLQKEKISPAIAYAILREEQENARSVTSEVPDLCHSPTLAEQHDEAVVNTRLLNMHEYQSFIRNGSNAQVPLQQPSKKEPRAQDVQRNANNATTNDRLLALEMLANRRRLLQESERDFHDLLVRQHQQRLQLLNYDRRQCQRTSLKDYKPLFLHQGRYHHQDMLLSLDSRTIPEQALLMEYHQQQRQQQQH